ncbi:MAG: sigma-54 dependent transcriptional regulator, partial [Acidobacteriota bacterium]
PSLIESELFGHVRGAFTGAVSDKKGRFELADGGTLFLDEVGDLALDLQAKLLSVLESGEFERVGGTTTIRVDVRLIAATHQDLKTRVASGHFREDLFHRLATVPIEVPPLRQRREDIPLLVWHFLERYEKESRHAIDKVSNQVMEAMQAYSWPGNVRELRNVVERAAILSESNELLLDPGSLMSIRPELSPDRDESLNGAMRSHILGVLERCDWRINGPGNTAERLGIHPNTLRHRLKKLGIERPS